MPPFGTGASSGSGSDGRGSGVVRAWTALASDPVFAARAGEGPAGELEELEEEASQGAGRCELDGSGILGDCERERPMSDSEGVSEVYWGGSKRSTVDIQLQGDVSTSDWPRLPFIPGRFAVANDGVGGAVVRAFVGDGWLLQLGDLAWSDSDRTGELESNEGGEKFKEIVNDD